MSKERLRILDMVAKGKISVEEAETLLSALEKGEPASVSLKETGTKEKPMPKFIYVKVTSAEEDNVDVKVPLSLIRAGMRLTSLIPPQAMSHINSSMAEHGVSIDLNNLKKEDIEVLIQSLVEMEINVDSKNGDKVRVFCT